MTIARMTPQNHNAIGAHPECPHDELRVYTAGTHNPTQLYIRRIIKFLFTRFVGSRV
jgi:hypothetical protein